MASCPEGAISVEERHTVELNRERAETQPRKKRYLHPLLHLRGRRRHQLSPPTQAQHAV
ncbi:hypothetical protein [Methanosarcina barkeri]|uniref:hypothetical protein n=1 Tax=Methanosarcina barkeri TaxID=2208 RepID=UPI0031202D1E